MDITTRFDRVGKWLQECVSQSHGSHEICSRRVIESGSYPTRLLKLDEVEKSGYVRLVATADYPNGIPEYTTLSHCWGHPEGPRPLETKRATLAGHKSGILLERLPKTFQDAVRITRRIGKKFLWIDSLCIVQDDRREWESEALNMAAIYHNSFLTIAAASSVNCEGGCGLEPWRIGIIQGRSTMDPNATYQMKLKRLQTSQRDEKLPLPLNTRGWTTQEWYLSPRTLYTTNQHIFWACGVHRDQEDCDRNLATEMVSVSKKIIDHKSPRFQEHLAQQWDSIIKNYSNRVFTHQADKIPAFAGIIQFHAAERKDDHVLGFWKKELPYSLGWWGSGIRQRSKIPGIPTWSWFSSMEKIMPSSDWSRDVLHQAILESWDVVWQRRPYVSSLVQGTVTLKTMTFETVLNLNIDHDIAVEKDFLGLMRCAGFSNVKLGVSYRSDCIMINDTKDDSKFTYMYLSTNSATSTRTRKVLDNRQGADIISTASPPRDILQGVRIQENIYLNFLVLRAVPDTPSVYTRVGAGHAKISSTDPTQEPWTSPILLESFLNDWKAATVQLC